MKPLSPSLLAQCVIGSALFCMYTNSAVSAVGLTDQTPGLIGVFVAQAAAQGWGLVLGADKNLARARALANTKKALIRTQPKIYACNGWFRVVAVYSDRTEALASLRTAIAASSDAPYVVSLANWCTSRREMEP